VVLIDPRHVCLSVRTASDQHRRCGGGVSRDVTFMRVLSCCLRRSFMIFHFCSTHILFSPDEPRLRGGGLFSDEDGRIGEGDVRPTKGVVR